MACMCVQRGLGEAAGRKSASELASEIQYCDVAHMNACRIRNREEGTFTILSHFMKAAGTSPLGNFEQTSVVRNSLVHTCMMFKISG